MSLRTNAEITLSESRILSKAVARAASLLEFNKEELATIVGVGESDLSKLYDGIYFFQSESKQFSSAVLFVRLFRSLDAIVGGNVSVAKSWLRNENYAFQTSPFEKIKDVAGLAEVVEYLDSQRAII